MEQKMYENNNGYPTLLLNSKEIKIGASASDTNARYHVYDEPFVMSADLRDQHDSKTPKFQTSGPKSGIKIAKDDDLDRWFNMVYHRTVHISNILETANSATASFYEFYSGEYLSKLDTYKNKNLWLGSNGKANENILVINCL